MVAVLMVGVLAVSGNQNAFASQFHNQNNVNIQAGNHAQNVIQANQQNINGDNRQHFDFGGHH
ncbi:MAG TPA: hypothetical protein VH796_18840 [Nitrososphaeraceae archaeon]